MSAATAHSPMNANWASGAFAERDIPAPPAALPQFDRLVYKLGLENRPDLWRDSQVLKSFAKANKKCALRARIPA